MLLYSSQISPWKIIYMKASRLESKGKTASTSLVNHFFICLFFFFPLRDVAA